jgi:hypothetical protein
MARTSQEWGKGDEGLCVQEAIAVSKNARHATSGDTCSSFTHYTNHASIQMTVIHLGAKPRAFNGPFFRSGIVPFAIAIPLPPVDEPAILPFALASP